jgi:hypothetical protein
VADVGVAAAASLVVAVGKPDIRGALIQDVRPGRVFQNFAHPIRQVRAGTRRGTP